MEELGAHAVVAVELEDRARRDHQSSAKTSLGFRPTSPFGTGRSAPCLASAFASRSGSGGGGAMGAAARAAGRPREGARPEAASGQPARAAGAARRRGRRRRGRRRRGARRGLRSGGSGRERDAERDEARQRVLRLTEPGQEPREDPHRLRFFSRGGPRAGREQGRLRREPSPVRRGTACRHGRAGPADVSCPARVVKPAGPGPAGGFAPMAAEGGPSGTPGRPGCPVEWPPLRGCKSIPRVLRLLAEPRSPRAPVEVPTMLPRRVLALLALWLRSSPRSPACGSRERPTAPPALPDLGRAPHRPPRRRRSRRPARPSARPTRASGSSTARRVRVEPEGLAWLRRDGGATLLVRGPAELTLRSDAVELAEGRVFVDTPAGGTDRARHAGAARSTSPTCARASTSSEDGDRGLRARRRGARPTARRAPRAGERLTLTGTGKDAKADRRARRSRGTTGPAASRTTDRARRARALRRRHRGRAAAGRAGGAALPARDPEARRARHASTTTSRSPRSTRSSSTRAPRWSRASTASARPTARRCIASASTATASIVWGRVKEKAAAAAQYQANVYQGSTEDPALLEWDAPGVYRARLYPIGPGETRRVVVQLRRVARPHRREARAAALRLPDGRRGRRGDRCRTSRSSTRRSISRHAGAKEVRAGMAGVRDGDTLVVREHDLVPRADLAVELFDDGACRASRGYRRRTRSTSRRCRPTERAEALRRARTEADYVLVPVRRRHRRGARGAAGSIWRSSSTPRRRPRPRRSRSRARRRRALLAHLGKDDRAVVWAGDAALRPVVPGQGQARAARRGGRGARCSRASPRIERGGATDLGAMLSRGGGGARSLAAARRGRVHRRRRADGGRARPRRSPRRGSRSCRGRCGSSASASATAPTWRS